MKKILVITCLLISCSFQLAAQIFPYKNKQLSIDARVKDLLQRMTPEEKFWQLFMIPGDIKHGEDSLYKNGLFGFQVHAAGADAEVNQQLLRYETKENALSLVKTINRLQTYFTQQTRLGIPIIPFDEALHGLVRDGATSFPQSIGMAATWDTAMMGKVARAIAYETKIRGIRQILSPVINIATDVRWGRTEETYGEDPYLTGEMGLAYIRAFQQQNIITTPKHFIANVGAGGRDSYPIDISDRELAEIHFPPFRKLIEKGKAGSIMTAYNSVDGSPATASKKLLTDVLRKQWQFPGFVISDASAVGGANVLHYTASDYADAGRKAINSGLDVIFQTQRDHYRLFIPHFLDGSIDTARINDAVSRVLKAKFELGLFDQPFTDTSFAADTSYLPVHRSLARTVAAASMVLLKNKGNILPLQASLQSIALIGTDAREARLGGYSGPGNQVISIEAGLKKALPNTRIAFANGPGRNLPVPTIIPADFLWHQAGEKLDAGLTGNYYAGITATGKPVLQRIDKQIDFHWTFYPPAPELNTDFYNIVWKGFLKAPATGNLQLGLAGNDGYRLYIRNQLVIDQWDKQSYHSRLTNITCTKDSLYPIEIHFREPVGNGNIKLVWDYGVRDVHQQQIREAVAVAQASDLAIIVAGIEEGEFRDRASLQLPGYQEQLIQAIAQTGKPVIVLLSGGSAVVMQNWIEDVAGIMNIWYPGEQGGMAIADVLTGKYNPAGRLPITYPLHEAQLPLVYNHKPTGRGDDYNNLSGQPLFPFGYGLSYTTFEYRDLRFSRNNIRSTDSVWVTCTIENTGKYDGEEVVQLYIRDELSSVARPVMELKGFQRVSLRKGESKTIQFLLHREHWQMLNADMHSVMEPGNFRIMIGASSRDIRLRGILTVRE
ncbi:MAG: beta-glucosidase [Chitinophagaceae bacterium]|nr:beta-glucosidase [Chitinophagaceae bacterium]